MKSLLTDLEITSIIRKNRVLKINYFEDELKSNKLYPQKLPFHSSLSPNSDVECKISMKSEFTLHDICNYDNIIFPEQSHQIKKSAILIPKGEEDNSSNPTRTSLNIYSVKRKKKYVVLMIKNPKYILLC